MRGTGGDSPRPQIPGGRPATTPPSTLRTTGAAMLAATLSACAPWTADTSRPGPATAEGAGAAATEIVVDARAAPTATLTVWLHPDRGARERLGIVSSDEVRRSVVDDVLHGSRARLVAEGSAGQEVASRGFTVLERAEVGWDVDLNVITLDRRPGA